MNKLKNAINLLLIVLSLISISASVHPFLLTLCYLVHESGHIIATKLCNGKIRKISVGVYKLAIGYDSYDLSYKQELLVSISGVIFNLIFAFAVFLLGNKESEVYKFLINCNLSLAIINLYPVSVLDGGRILKLSLLSLFLEEKAEKISKTVSFVCAILLWFVCIYIQLAINANISMLFISVYLLIQLCFSI